MAMRFNSILLKSLCIIILLLTCACQKIADQRKKVYYEEGIQNFNAGKYVAASELFQKAVIFDPKYFDAIYMTGYSFYKVGDFGKARVWFLKALTERPNDLKLRLMLIESFIKTKNPRWAMGACKELFQIDPANHDGKKFYIQAMLWTAEYLNQAGVELTNLLNEQGNDPQLYCLLAEYKIRKGNLKEAEDVIIKHNQSSKDYLNTILLLIERYRAKGDNEGIEKMYQQILNNTADKLPYQKKLLEFYRENGEQEKEKLLYITMINDYPDLLQIKLNYVDYLIHYNKLTDAGPMILSELKKQPDNIDLKKLLLSLYGHSKQQTKAINKAKEILDNSFSDINIYIEIKNILAELYFQTERYDLSKDISHEVLQESPENRDARFNLCRINLKEGKILSTIGDLRKLIQENPNIADYQYYLGLAHEMRGEFIMAENAFKATLDMSPVHKEALIKWVTLYSKHGILNDLQQRIDKYLQINPGDNDIKSLLRTIENQRGSRILSKNTTIIKYLGFVITSEKRGVALTLTG